jgi:hypothetical protein
MALLQRVRADQSWSRSLNALREDRNPQDYL